MDDLAVDALFLAGLLIGSALGAWLSVSALIFAGVLV